MTEDYKKNTARAIKQRRISMGLNLKEVAARSGVSSSHLGRIERGERSPSFTVLRKIVNPLGFGEKELLALAGYLPSQPSSEVQGRTEHGYRNSGHLKEYSKGARYQENSGCN